MDNEHQEQERSDAQKRPRAAKKDGGSFIRPSPTISPQSAPSMFAELSRYPKEQQTGRYAELAAYGLACWYRSIVEAAPQAPVVAKPVAEAELPQPVKPNIDDSKIDLDLDSGL